MITVFTPTFNRAYILDRVYQSLRNQTSKNFEWIIVDDGSTDNTESLVSSWIKNKNEFSIFYIKQENGGKHRAINKAISYAKGEWFSIIDSDDYYYPNAIENIELWINNVDSNNIAGVVGTRTNSDGTIIGGMPLMERNMYIDISTFDRKKYHLLGDKSEVIRTSIWKKYPFPEFEGEKFLSEAAFFDRISFDGYILRYYNTPLKVCDYLDDGLTKNTSKILKNNYKGYTYCLKLIIDNATFLRRQLAIANYIAFSDSLNLRYNTIYNNIKCSRIEFFFIFYLYKFYRFIKNFLIKLKKK